MTGDELTPEAVARLAGLEATFVHRAVSAGALGPRSRRAFGREDASRLRFLHAWDAAGFSVETIGRLVDQGQISFSFLQVPSFAARTIPDVTYAELVAESGIGMSSLRALHVALGFTPPSDSDVVHEDDRLLIELSRMLQAVGVGEAAWLRVMRVHSGALRRMVQAEAELYEAEVERPRIAAGATQQELLAFSGDAGRAMEALLEQAILALYRRHRQHVWLDHSVTHVEAILEEEGLYERVEKPPCVCFVDLSGFTGITEERGDEHAASLADRLAALAEGVTHRHGGRAVRWLGDGGMFVFHEPEASVRAAIEVVGQAPERGLPPTHIGIHCGPVVFQDGDIYGRTVNIAARLASRAVGGEVLVSRQVAERLPPDLALEDLGAVELKGLAEPFPVYRVPSAAVPA